MKNKFVQLKKKLYRCGEKGVYGKTVWQWCDGSTTQYVSGCVLKGYKVSGVGSYADKSIFLPIAGYFVPTYQVIKGSGITAAYWSSTVLSLGYSYNLSFGSDNRCTDGEVREFGQSVRAVYFDASAVTEDTALDDASAEHVATKLIRDGKIVIVRDGKEYDVVGHQL